MTCKSAHIHLNLFHLALSFLPGKRIAPIHHIRIELGESKCFRTRNYRNIKVNAIKTTEGGLSYDAPKAMGSTDDRGSRTCPDYIREGPRPGQEGRKQNRQFEHGHDRDSECPRQYPAGPARQG